MVKYSKQKGKDGLQQGDGRQKLLMVHHRSLDDKYHRKKVSPRALFLRSGRGGLAQTTIFVEFQKILHPPRRDSER